MRAPWVGKLSLLATLAPLAALAGEGVHPQDGPDVDLRIRIDDDAVRLQVTMNLAFIDEIVEGTREDESTLHPVEHAGIRAELADYFRDECVVEIDGVAVSPIAGEIAVPEPELSLLPLFPKMGMRAVIKARIVFDYPVKAAPGSVSIVWPAYPADVAGAGLGEEAPPMEIQALLTAEGKDSLVGFTIDEPRYVWRSSGGSGESFLAVPAPVVREPLVLPVASIAVIVVLAGGVLALGLTGSLARNGRRLAVALPLGAAAAWALRSTYPVEVELATPALDEKEALAIFAPLHANIYRAFDYTEEADVYDALARSVDGALLDSLYNEIYGSLVLQEEGGAVSRVQAVTPLETEVGRAARRADGRLGFEVTARWQVEGYVYHWGHSHTRLNEYQARYAVVASQEGWRIAESETLEQFRVDSKPGAPLEIPSEL